MIVGQCSFSNEIIVPKGSQSTDWSMLDEVAVDSLRLYRNSRSSAVPLRMIVGCETGIGGPPFSRWNLTASCSVNIICEASCLADIMREVSNERTSKLRPISSSKSSAVDFPFSFLIGSRPILIKSSASESDRSGHSNVFEFFPHTRLCIPQV